tara:strand:+ start:40 stop:462 length:423 start_codon:yes stop_codon:yes gene_type:complete
MAVIGSAEKATTLIKPGKKAHNQYAPAYIIELAGAIPVNYSSSSLATVLDVTGSGYLAISGFQSLVGSTAATAKVTIDGVVVLNDSAGNIVNVFMMQVGSLKYSSDGTAVSRERVIFNKSLLVQVSCDSNSTYFYDYYLN